MSRQVRWSNRAEKDLERLDRKVRQRIVSAVDRFAQTGQGDVKRLQGMKEETFRLRVGEWRIIFLEEETLFILILRALPRSGAYHP
ncbi:MAG TPA: type II toxin-antitoxin system RelE/ParE family toxin [Thermoanaerobaculia bacterium]